MDLQSWNSTPLVSERDFCFSVTGDLKEVVSKGSQVFIVMKYGPLPLVYETKDLCNDSCSEGQHIFNFCIPLPDTGAGVR